MSIAIILRFPGAEISHELVPRYSTQPRNMGITGTPLLDLVSLHNSHQRHTFSFHLKKFFNIGARPSNLSLLSIDSWPATAISSHAVFDNPKGLRC